MPRIILTITLIAGCAAGISYGYFVQRTMTKPFAAMRSITELPATPTNFISLSNIQAIDTLQKTVTIDLTSPYDRQKTLTLTAHFDDTTFFQDAKSNPLTIAQFHAGDTVTVLLKRQEGPLHISTIVLF